MPSRNALYRIAAACLTAMALGHSWAFLDPGNLSAGALAVREAMAAARFPLLGREVSLEGFYLGFGWLGTVFLAFAAYCAWSLGGLKAGAARQLRPLGWALAASQMGVALLAALYFVLPPLALSLLAAAAVLAAEGRPEA